MLLIGFVLLCALHYCRGQCGPFGSQTGLDNGVFCLNPTTQFCRCLCTSGQTPYSGYIGFHGGELSYTLFEGVCGLYTQFMTTANYVADECSEHCNYDIRTSLCSGHGIPNPAEAAHTNQAFTGGQPAGLFTAYLDIQAVSLKCICDPGFYGYRDQHAFCHRGYNCYYSDGDTPVPNMCFASIATDFCSGQGTDISGSGNPVGVGTCTGQAHCTGTPCPKPDYFVASTRVQDIWAGCSNMYLATDPLSSLVCLCNPTFVGGQPGQRGQCARTVNQFICSGHGHDTVSSPSTTRYPANVPTTGAGAPSCQCDPFFGVVISSSPQCSVFLPCAQSQPCGGPGIGSCAANGLSCNCNAPAFGAGGLTQPAPCCPLQFGTGVVCGGHPSACMANSQCSCPALTQGPGCCPICDAGSQTCQLDGRCSCPSISGKLCGAYGSCISNAPVITCNCTNGQTTLSDGSVATVQLGGLFCCPMLQGIGTGPCGGGLGVCSSTPTSLDPAHPTTSLTGFCSTCPAAPQQTSPLGVYTRTGHFCCPIITAIQSVPCGQFGVCQPDGTCRCLNARFSGLACEINLNCDFNAAGVQQSSSECSSAGVCTLHNTGSFGLGDYLLELRFNDVAGVSYRTNDSVVIQDEGAVMFLRQVYRAFLGFDPATQRNESLYYQQGLAACQAAGSSRSLCLWNMLVACQPQRDARFSALGAVVYLQNALAVIDANAVASFAQGAYETALATALAPGCAGQPREAMASFMLWDLWRFLYRTDIADPNTLPRFSVFTISPTFTTAPWKCICSATSSGVLGSNTAVGGPRCQFTTCPLGLDNQPCSGFSQGVFRGYCTGGGTCECSPKFQGHACEISLTPGCFPIGSVDTLPCSAHGSCAGANCSCLAQYSGRYCDLSRCQPPGVLPQPGECNNRGICSASTLTCTCSDPAYDTGSQNIVPGFLSTGNACEQNGQSACGIFVQNPLSAPGVGNWQICSNHGQCMWNYTANVASCICSGHTFGPQCQNSACLPLCNANQHCDITTGGCNCQRFWATPTSCITPNRTCECSVNLCLNGIPSADGSSCICNPGFKKAAIGPTAGTCSIVQCPLTVYNDQGVRPCNPTQGDIECTDILSITESLATGCCVDTCPVCNLNAISGVRTCDCNTLSGFAACYTQLNGICFPNCHGSDALLPANPPNCDSTSAPGTLQCHCDFVTLGPNQFKDLRCQRYTCANGGLPPSGRICNPLTSSCCDCSKTAYTGSFCSISACGAAGTPLPNGTACACTLPFFRTGASPLCDGNHCSPGTAVKSATTGTFVCNCPGNTFAANDSLSCRTLDCLGQDAALCSVCLNNGVASLVAGQIQCDCSKTSFTGSDCSIPVCLHGGTPKDATSCACVAPFAGQFCQTVQCFNGGVATSTACTCPIEWTGSQCSVASGRTAVHNVTVNVTTSSSSSTGAASSSSSSTAAAVAAATTTNTALVVGLSTAGAVVAAAGIGYGIYAVVAAKALAASTAAAAASAAPTTASASIALAALSARYESLERQILYGPNASDEDE